MQKPGLISTVGALLQGQADPNVVGPRRRTPLHVACAGGSAEIVERLLLVGAHMEALDEDGQTPAQIAAQLGAREILDVLNNMKVDVDPIFEAKDSATAPKAPTVCPMASKQPVFKDVSSNCGCLAFWRWRAS